MKTSLAGIKAPDTRMVQLALKLAEARYKPYLLQHCWRTFYFGALLGKLRGWRFDAEVLVLACLLHDLGLTGPYMGPLPFEIEGAQAAKKLLTAHGFSAAKTRQVWSGIAMHPLAIAEFQPPSIRLVAAGAGADVLGDGLRGLPAQAIREVLAAHPRLGFKKKFVASCARVAGKYPLAAARNFLRDIGDRQVPGFHEPNICDGIAQAPFKD